MSRSDERELKTRLSLLIIHLLKWQFQPERSGRSWRRTIGEQRRRMLRVTSDNPSLENFVIDRIQSVYRTARAKAAGETGIALDSIPPDCPFLPHQILDPNFFPDQRSSE